MTITAAPQLPARPPLDAISAPATFRSGPAPGPRTLPDILHRTVQPHPNAPALDDGTRVLTYRALQAEVDQLRGTLVAAGIGGGDRVGIRVPSGTADLYVAILAVLASGAAYVPVDADDPDERAGLVFTEADVCAVLGAGRALTVRGAAIAESWLPTPDADAWIIFTSGSTGRPKGVAVSHRSAAALVDAEALLFLTDEPLGPGHRWRDLPNVLLAPHTAWRTTDTLDRFVARALANALAADGVPG